MSTSRNNRLYFHFTRILHKCGGCRKVISCMINQRPKLKMNKRRHTYAIVGFLKYIFDMNYSRLRIFMLNTFLESWYCILQHIVIWDPSLYCQLILDEKLDTITRLKTCDSASVFFFPYQKYIGELSRFANESVSLLVINWQRNSISDRNYNGAIYHLL
jgi:hypothetical protein